MTDRSDAPVVTLTDLLRGVPAMLPDLPSIVRGLTLLERGRSSHRRSIGRAFQEAAHRHPERPFLRFHGQDLTYGEANLAVNRIAEVLSRRGVGRGDTVALCLTNRPESVLCMLAVVKLGAAAGLLNHHQRGDVLDHSQQILDSTVTLVGAECGEAFASVDRADWGGTVVAVDVHHDLEHVGCAAGTRPAEFDGLPWLDDETGALGSTEGATDPEVTEHVRGREAAYYVFTSGTTGMPKASTMTHHRWSRAMAGFGLAGVRLRGDDVLFCPLPMYHNNAVTVALGCVLATGSCLAVGEHFSASRFWDQVREDDATAAIYIGEICRYLLAQPEKDSDRDHRLRLVTGNGLRPELWETFRSRFGVRRIAEFYAASECNVAFVNAFDVDGTNGYCPMDYAIVEHDGETGMPLLDDDGRMRRVPRGGAGLLVSAITDVQPFDGYTDAEATESKIVRNGLRDGDAWFVSGDLMVDQGHHHALFVDRLGDTFRWKGENVSASQVESALSEDPQVDQCAVYGVEMPDADGRAGMAAVVPAAGSDELDGRALADGLRERLPKYAVPVFVRVVDELETTSTNKVRKTDLKEQGHDPEKVDDPLYVLSSDSGYVPAYDGCAEDVVAGKVRG